MSGIADILNEPQYRAIQELMKSSIREERLRRALSQEQLGQLAGMCQSEVARFEQWLPAGKRGRTLEMFLRLATALDMEVQLLVSPAERGDT